VWSERSESVKYCIPDQCEGYEPGVQNVWMYTYLLRVILEIIVSVLFSLLMIVF
jgi:hypothetical protein